MKLVIANQYGLEKKISSLRSGGRENLQMVIDFDRTLTPSKVAGQEAVNSSGIFVVSGLLGARFAQIYDQLFQKYFPLEIDPSLTREQKIPLMEQWTRGVVKALIDNGLNQSIMKRMVDSGLLQLRPGVKRFFELAREADLPMVIFSAGWGDVIEMVLFREGVKSKNVHVVANFLNFDQDGRVTGLKGKLINILNKSEVAIAEAAFYADLVERPNVLLVGDSLHDIHMADGIPHKTVLRVGLLNNPTPLNVKKYSEVFDLVMEGDGDFYEVNKLLKEIL